MFKKSSVIFLITISFCLVPLAQQQPTPKPMQIFINGDGSYLGIELTEVSKENLSKFGLNEVRGVAVEKVVENSPAAQAGLQNGDVIIKFNGEEVSSVRKLMRLISEVAPDHQAKIVVLRSGSEREFTATIGKRPAPKFEQANFPPFSKLRIQVPELPLPIDGEQINADTLSWMSNDRQSVFIFSASRQIGIGVNSLTKQLGEYFGISDGKGLLINNVIENSSASRAGLRAGDVIVEIDGKAVANQIDLVRIIGEKKEGDVSLTIIRDKQRQTVKITPEKIEPKDIKPKEDNK
jgi:serine protease Do